MRNFRKASKASLTFGFCCALQLASLFSPAPATAQNHILRTENLHSMNTRRLDGRRDSNLSQLALRLTDSAPPRSLQYLEMSFTSSPGLQVQRKAFLSALERQFRMSRVRELTPQHIAFEAGVILDVLLPRANYSTYRALQQEIKTWYEAEPFRRMIVRIEPQNSGGRHGLALIRIENDTKAQALLIQLL